MRIRTISAILVWAVAALLVANIYFKSDLIFWISIALVIIAVLVYFIPTFKKMKAPPSRCQRKTATFKSRRELKGEKRTRGSTTIIA